MNVYILAGGLLSLAIQLFLCQQVLTGKIRGFNFLSWFLWAMIDGIAAGSVICQSGNFLLPLVFAVGSLSVALAILKSEGNCMKWTWFETFIATSVTICLIVWAAAGSRTATIASTTATVLAGLPQFKDIYLRPWETSIWIWVGFFIGNGLSTMGGKDWSIEERFYPGMCTALCVLLVIAVLLSPHTKPQEEGER